jgi:alpha-L-fucosidase
MLLTPMSLALSMAAGSAGLADPMSWWREARFGMFIHWGLYSIPAGEWNGKKYGGASEWLMYSAQIKAADYHPLQSQFNPVQFNAREWARIAKRAGMKYIVITSKHHDGFCLWDSKLTDWDIMGSPFRRDILKELAEACRAEKIRLGFYHSILDWTHPHYGQRAEWDPRPEVGPVDMDKYTAYMKGQLKELLTEYGDVATVWFDGEWESAWTHERGKDLYAYVKSLQPNTLVNNRVDKGRSGMAGMTSGEQFKGDYGTPEQEVPARGLPGVDWESCMTMNGSWGYHKGDNNWKSAQQLIDTLVETASKGGNFLLNVGPTSEGLIPEASVTRLAEVGKWLRTHGKAIYGTSAGPFSRSPYRWTTKRGALFCFVSRWPGEALELRGIQSPVTSVSLVGGGRLTFRQDGETLLVTLPKENPQTYTAVLEIRHRGELRAVDPPLMPNQQGTLDLAASLAEIEGSALRHEGDWLGFWTQAKDSCRWEAEGVSAGRYRVEVEYAVESGGSSVGEVVVGGKALPFQPKSTGSWRTFRKDVLGEVTVGSGGKVVVQVKVTKMDGAFCNLRSVRLIRM